jgi:hypothetical protein
MEPYVCERYRALLTRQRLYTFASFWDLPWDELEGSNRRPNGWSVISRHTIFDNEVGRFSILLKRQENHNYWTLRHPFRGRPTLYRKLCNTLNLKQIGVPTVQPLFYGERRESDKYQAVLAIVALEGYSDLNSLFQDSLTAVTVRQIILHRLAEAIQLLHRNCLQYNNLSGNHVLVKLEENNMFDLRIIGIERITHAYRRINAAVKDLEGFVCGTPSLTIDERAEFLFHYARHFTDIQRDSLMKKINHHRSSHVQEIACLL